MQIAAATASTMFATMVATTVSTTIVVRFCATCQADAMFEQPECIDDHGVDCPEEVCCDCGDAFVVGFSADESPGHDVSVRHVA